MPAQRGKNRAICLNACLILVTVPLLSIAADALAWTGHPGTYPAFAYGQAVYHRPQVMAARVRPASFRYPAYPQYPTNAPLRQRSARPVQQPAVHTPAQAAKGGPPAQGKTKTAPATANLSSDSHKQRFFEKLLPLVTRENERLLGVRRELTELQTALARGTQLQEARLKWLRELAEDYRVEVLDDTGALIEVLLERVDVIPAGLALAQAANESAWGKSRFAKEGNNLFGTWTYDTDKGIKPKRRAAGKRHLVRNYDSLEASVRDYMHNLNSHPAYRPMRERRAALRAERQPLSATHLAGGLTAYAENGDEYVELIQSMIRSNKLEHIAQLQLADAGQLD